MTTGIEVLQSASQIEVILPNGTTQVFGQPAAVEIIPTAGGVFNFSGGASGSQRIDQVTPAGTWILSHSRGAVPNVAIYLATGECVQTDVVASATVVTVVWSIPTVGFVILS